MATNAKIIMFFGQGPWGWQEEIYWTSSVDDNLSGLLNDTKGMVKLRRAILGTQHSLEAARMEIVNDAGDSFTIGASQIAYNRAGGGKGSNPGDCQNVWVALLMRAYDPTRRYGRNFEVRGIPDNQVCVGPAYAVPYQVSPLLKVKLDSYIGWITSPESTTGEFTKTGTFSMRVIDKAHGRGNAKKVTAIVVGNDRRLTITTAAPIQVWTGAAYRAAEVADTVHLHKTSGYALQGTSGNWEVVAMPGVNQYTLTSEQQHDCSFKYNMKATVWGVNYILAPITVIDPSRVNVHKTGAAFFGTRGRQRARCR